MSLDRPCYRHPDRPAEAHCQKYDRYLCAECIACRQPKNHCTFRTMCIIWEWLKHGLPPELQARPGESPQPAESPQPSEPGDEADSSG